MPIRRDSVLAELPPNTRDAYNPARPLSGRCRKASFGRKIYHGGALSREAGVLNRARYVLKLRVFALEKTCLEK